MSDEEVFAVHQSLDLMSRVRVQQAQSSHWVEVLAVRTVKMVVVRIVEVAVDVLLHSLMGETYFVA